MTSRNFHIQTFGCQMNANDSDWLCRSLTSRGFVQTDFDNASLYIINTCSVRDKPEQKVYSELGRIARLCKVQGRSGVTICVGGCVAQQVGPALTRRFPQVRLLFGSDGIAQAPEAISRLVEEPGLRLSLLDFVEHFEERQDTWADTAVPPGVFVNIMQGCDNFCTYCIVPYVRGRQKSRSPEAILAQCTELLKKGAREITLLGQNVNSYGQDPLGQGVTFSDLLGRVSLLPGLERLRFVTPHPKDMAPEVIRAFAENPLVCPRLHLPLQSGSDAILKRMGRRYTAAHFLDLVEKLRAARPDILLSTDIIVGFPGETEDDFLATMNMMERCGFAASFSFVYSDRPRAKATLLSHKVERAVALERLARLQLWQEVQAEKILLSLVGQTVTVLLETKSQRAVVLADDADKEGTTLGANAPETDAAPLEYWQGKTPHGLTVNVALPPRGTEKGWSGAMLPVYIEAKARHSLKGRKAGEPW